MASLVISTTFESKADKMRMMEEGEVFEDLKEADEGTRTCAWCAKGKER